jgi:sn-glycerol 3-phosphate transport system ATP-binding protein
MADRVVLVRDGRVEQEGAPEDLYFRPASTFAARFIGTPGMNLVALADGAGGAVIRGSRETVLRGRGAGYTLGVRPEHVRIAESGGVAGSVASAEYHGADTILTVAVGEETMLVRSPGQLAHAVGSAVHLAWKAESMHVFDATSGARAAANVDMLATPA